MSITVTPAPGTVALREGLVAIKGTLARVQTDLTADALQLDSTPFTGLGVGEALGAHLAMTAVLAQLTEQLVDFVGLLSTSLDLVHADVRRVDQAVRNVDGRVGDLEGL